MIENERERDWEHSAKTGEREIWNGARPSDRDGVFEKIMPTEKINVEKRKSGGKVVEHIGTKNEEEKRA